jgi:hypothetical protein
MEAGWFCQNQNGMHLFALSLKIDRNQFTPWESSDIKIEGTAITRSSLVAIRNRSLSFTRVPIRIVFGAETYSRSPLKPSIWDLIPFYTSRLMIQSASSRASGVPYDLNLELTLVSF